MRQELLKHPSPWTILRKSCSVLIFGIPLDCFITDKLWQTTLWKRGFWHQKRKCFGKGTSTKVVFKAWNGRIPGQPHSLIPACNSLRKLNTGIQQACKVGNKNSRGKCASGYYIVSFKAKIGIRSIINPKWRQNKKPGRVKKWGEAEIKINSNSHCKLLVKSLKWQKNKYCNFGENHCILQQIPAGWREEIQTSQVDSCSTYLSKWGKSWFC